MYPPPFSASEKNQNHSSDKLGYVLFHIFHNNLRKSEKIYI